MKKMYHVTIGIPAFNEEANIARLIYSLFRQKQENFVLDKIIVVLDGSTDNTKRILQNLEKQYPKLIYIYDPIRKGVTYRLQQLIDLNLSDILVFFDGDTLPENPKTLKNLVTLFNDNEIKLATAALIPVKPLTGFERILFSWRLVWTRLTHDWKNGNNIYNFRGVGIAMRKDFAKSIHLPVSLSGASSHFMYLKAKQQKIKTAFSKIAVIHYRLATTLKDYLLQINRGQNDGKILKSMFPEIYEIEYLIPLQVRIYNVFKNMIYLPLDTIVGTIFHMLIPVLNSRAKPSDKNGTWKSVESTKIIIDDRTAPNI